MIEGSPWSIVPKEKVKNHLNVPITAERWKKLGHANSKEYYTEVKKNEVDLKMLTEKNLREKRVAPWIPPNGFASWLTSLFRMSKGYCRWNTHLPNSTTTTLCDAIWRAARLERRAWNVLPQQRNSEGGRIRRGQLGSGGSQGREEGQTAGKEATAWLCEGQRGYSKCRTIPTAGQSFTGRDTSSDTNASSEAVLGNLGHLFSSYFWPVPGLKL